MSEKFEALLTAFIKDRFLNGDLQNEFTTDTPLLEWGILDSLKIAMLLNFIRDELGVSIPFQDINSRNFRDVGSIARLAAAQATGPAYADSAQAMPPS